MFLFMQCKTSQTKDSLLVKKATLEQELNKLKRTFDDEKNQLDIEFEEIEKIVKEKYKNERSRDRY